MGATGAPKLSQDGDGTPRAREGLALARRAARVQAVLRNRSPLLVSAIMVCAAVAFVSLLTYYGARTFTSRAADARAAEEAASFATHSSLLATGDAFNGYLQILSYSEDPVVRTRTADSLSRRDAMQRLLWLNTNKMAALAIADRSGLVLATTDEAIRNVRTSTAFNASRANLGPTNSDILLPEEGKRGYVEYASPLRDLDGSVWGFLYARAEPQVLWRDTLNATIDGGHNVIINSEGRFAAGVPDALLGQSWRGSPLDDGGVRADIATVDSICGLGAIGRDTQIDHGWFVASCLPASLIQVEAARALGNQGQVTIAGAVLALVIAIGFLRLAFGGAPTAATMPQPAEATLTDSEEQTLAPELFTMEPELDLGTPTPEPAVEALPPVPDVISSEPPTPPVEPAPPVVIVADVDALSLIEAYEQRNALISQELRESVQARLMIAATQATEAYRLADAEPERAGALHRAAIDEIDSIREHDLRGMGQELHPSLVRLGLPGALRSLQREFEGRIAVDLALDANVDGASSRGGRITIDPRLRLIVYRLVRDSVRALLEADISVAQVSLERDGLEIAVTITSALPDGGFTAPHTLLADDVALQAFGGSLSVETLDAVRIVARVIAPHVEQPEPDVALVEVEPDPDSRAVELHVPEEDEAGTQLSLIDALESMPREFAGAIDVRLSLEAAPDAMAPDTDVAAALLAVSREGVAGFAESGASACEIALELAHDAGTLTISGPAHLSVERLDAIRLAGERAACSVSIASHESGVSIALAFDAQPIALEPAHVKSFTLPEGEPPVVDLTDRPHPANIPANATTFRLPDDEPLVIDATDADDHGSNPAEDDAVAADGDDAANDDPPAFVDPAASSDEDAA